MILLKFRQHLVVPGAVLFLLILSLNSPAQSGWTKEKGRYFSKLSYNFYSSNQYYNLTGDKLETSTFKQQGIFLYGEYGLTDKLTLLTSWPVFKANSFETTSTVYGIGDLIIGAKYSLLKGKFPVAFSITPEIPLAPADNYAQNKVNSFEQINLPTGDGEWNFLFNLAASHSFYPLPVYASAYATYNKRTSYKGVDFSDQFVGGVEVGANILKHAWVNAKLTAQKTLGTNPGITDFIRGEGTEFTAISLGVYVPVYKGWGIDLNYYNYTDWIIKRQNLYSAGIISVGIVFEKK